MKGILKKLVVAVLTWEAQRVLAKYKPKIVAVTGSVGKTGTKDAVYTLLSSVAFARKSEKSFNSELGVPLTILGLPTAWSSARGWLENIIEGLHLLVRTQPYPEWLVVEVGADRPGDIKRLAWLQPHLVIFTRFPDVPVHVEFFSTPEEVIAEKRELKKALRSDGTLIVNGDDPLMQHEEVLDGQRVVTYGFGEDTTVGAEGCTINYADGVPWGMSCTARFQSERVPLVLQGTLGHHHMYSLLAALAVAVTEGVVFAKAVAALGSHTSPPGRMRVLSGIQHTTIIDDTYNASPVAVAGGLDTVAEVKVSGKKIVVLGDMMELGEFSVNAHKAIGAHVAAVADVFIAVGVRMMAAAETVRAEGGQGTRVETAKDAMEAIALVSASIQEGDLLYIKGSQSTRMERVVEAFLNDPVQAPALLVRQDKEWKQRE